MREDLTLWDFEYYVEEAWNYDKFWTNPDYNPALAGIRHRLWQQRRQRQVRGPRHTRRRNHLRRRHG